MFLLQCLGSWWATLPRDQVSVNGRGNIENWIRHQRKIGVGISSAIIFLYFADVFLPFLSPLS